MSIGGDIRKRRGTPAMHRARGDIDEALACRRLEPVEFLVKRAPQRKDVLVEHRMRTWLPWV